MSSFLNSNFLGILLFLIFIFFILREFWCWYFKLNKISNLLEKIEQNTSKYQSEFSDQNLTKTSSNEPDKDARTSMLDPRMNWK
jgi:hypothetical protein